MVSWQFKALISKDKISFFASMPQNEVLHSDSSLVYVFLCPENLNLSKK
jgi:hypothetical protein